LAKRKGNDEGKRGEERAELENEITTHPPFKRYFPVVPGV
jgi:hypothetical protein